MSKRKDDRPINDIEYEQQKEECTFAPKPMATKDLSQVFGKSVSAQISPRYNQI